jgi:hypothetical protein
MEIESSEEIRVVNDILKMLHSLEPEARRRVLATIDTFIKYDESTGTRFPHLVAVPEQQKAQSQPRVEGDFSTDRTISAKQFLFEKKPQSDVERIACLAYYLTHYQNMLEFQTRDISLLNTEAAQRKLSNPWHAVSNAIRAGYIIRGSTGYYRLSAMGEVYIGALPDRDTAKDAIADTKPMRKQKKSAAKRIK